MPVLPTPSLISNDGKMSPALTEQVLTLLKERDDQAIVELIGKLVEINYRQLRQVLDTRRGQMKNEGVSSDQLALLFEQLQDVIEHQGGQANAKLKAAAQDENKEGQQAKNPRKPPPRKRPLPTNLPVVDHPINVPAGERECPVCGEERVCIGHDVTSVIDIIPAQAIIRRDRREKLACKNCETELVRAPLGDKVVDGGSYGARLVADLMVSKYDDGLPLERQKERYRRLGLDLPSASMGDQIAWATDLLQPVARRLFDQALDSDLFHLDATSLPVLDRDAAKGIKIGALWGYVGINVSVQKDKRVEERSAVYLYTTTGKKVGQEEDELGPEEVLSMRRGRGKPHVIADAAGLFDLSFKRPGLTEVACNMHARRYFAKALDGGDLRAALPIAAYKKIYNIEESVHDQPPDDRLAMRVAKAKPVYDELLAWCETFNSFEPPSSLLGKAIRYTLNHRLALTRFLANGVLPIDNGVVERLHRRPAMGRRAYLFAGSDAGAQRAAIAYSVLGTCRLAGINPTDYLCHALPRLARGISVARDLPGLMPLAWARSRA